MGDEKAFVVMQVGNEGSPERKRADEVYNFIVKPALAQFDIQPYRADLDPSPGSVTPRMLKELVEARLIVADLTGRNPNVFYELGISHSFNRPLICIADSATHLPFDAKDERIIQLGDYPEAGLTYVQGEKAKSSLVESLRVVLADGYQPPSPLRGVAANRSLDQLATNDPVAAELADMREVLDEIREKVNVIRLAVPPGILADIEAMRGLLEEASSLIDEDRLYDLKTSDTSSGHDRWVENLVKAKEQARRPAVDPWSVSTGPSDEPPF